MVSNVGAIDNSCVVERIDAILGEIEEALSATNSSSVKVEEGNQSSKLDVASARENILKTV